MAEPDQMPAACEALRPCLLCGAASEHFIARGRFEIIKCARCGFMRATMPAGFDLRTVYTDDNYWTGGTDWGYSGGFDGYWRAVRPFYEVRLHRIEAIARGKRLLEVGCADGRFLGLARRRGFNVAGVELSAMMRGRCVERAGCRVYESVDAVIAGGERFDCVVMFEVIEHLADPVAALRAVRGLMNPDAVLALSTPNFGCRAAVLNPAGFEQFSPPAHISYFNAATLAAGLRQAGFSAITIEASFAAQELPLPAPVAAILRPLRRGKRLRPHGALGRILKAYMRMRALAMPCEPGALERAETLELYARNPGG